MRDSASSKTPRSCRDRRSSRPASTSGAFDQFDTRSASSTRGQVGVRAGQVWRNRFFANVTGNLALGDTHQTVDINGPRNHGHPARRAGHSSSRAACWLFRATSAALLRANEVLGRPGRERQRRLSRSRTTLRASPSAIPSFYWSGVERPSDAIDLRRVNSTRVPTSLVPPSVPAAPLFAFGSSDFWA